MFKIKVKNTLKFDKLTKIDFNDFGRKASAELLDISRLEVPFLSGDLSKSGSTGQKSDGTYYTAYNTDYATYQHEGGDRNRIITRHSMPKRKSKFLEDPLKYNLSRWLKVAGMSAQEQLKKTIK